MTNIGCTLVQKESELACDLSITWDFQRKRGSWTKLKNSGRPITQKFADLNFGEKGDVIEARDLWDGKEIFALSIYPSGAQVNIDTAGRTNMPAIAHLFCGNAKSVFDSVACGKFLSGKAIFWRTRKNGEFEFWFSCS